MANLRTNLKDKLIKFIKKDPRKVRLGDDIELKGMIKPKVTIQDGKLKVKKLNMSLKFTHNMPDNVELYIGINGVLTSLAQFNNDEKDGDQIFKAKMKFTKKF